MIVSRIGVLIAAALFLAGGCQSAPAAEPASSDIQAGPIWNQADAELKCPVAAHAVRGRWNGQWVTTVPNEMSVCGVIGASRQDGNGQANIEAGPIWSQDDALVKCPVVAAATGGAWTGQWRTTVWGKMSVCEINW